MSKLQEMGIFMKVIEHGSFSKAADVLGVSPPTITRAINNLEIDLGSRLFLRSTRHVQPTEAAEQYYQDCKEILEAIEQAEHKLKSDHNEIAGQLTITAPEYFGEKFIVPLIAEFSQKYPEIRIKTIMTNREVNLIKDKVNISVRLGKLEDSSLFVTRVGASKKILCASPEYVSSQGIPENPNDLKSRTIISVSDVGDHPLKLNFPDLSSPVQIQPTLVFNTKRAVIETALAGYGIALLMNHYAYEYVESGQLEVIFPDVKTEIVPISILHCEGREITRRTRALYDFIVDHLRSNPALAIEG